MKSLKWLLSLTVFLTYSIAFSQNNTGLTRGALPKTKAKEQRNSLSFYGGMNSLSSDITSVFGLDMGFSFHHALNDKWALYSSFYQGINTASLATLYSEISGGAIFAYRGSHIKRYSSTKIDGVEVAETDILSQGGLFIQAGIKQYFFNGSSTVIPLIGPEVGAYMQYPSDKMLNLLLGGSLNYGLNGSRTLLSIRAYAGLLFWL